jgi:hypothetical protein
MFCCGYSTAHLSSRTAPDAEVPADLRQLLCGIIRVEQVHAATHITPRCQLGVACQEQPALLRGWNMLQRRQCH